MKLVYIPSDETNLNLVVVTNCMPQGVVWLGIIDSYIKIDLTYPALSLASLSGRLLITYLVTSWYQENQAATCIRIIRLTEDRRSCCLLTKQYGYEIQKAPPFFIKCQDDVDISIN